MRVLNKGALDCVIGITPALLLATVLRSDPVWADQSIQAESMDRKADGAGPALSILNELPAFLGTTQGAYINLGPSSGFWRRGQDRASVATQFAIVFSQGLGDPRVIDGAHRIIASNKAPGAMDQAFVVTQANGRTIVAAALLHRNCGKFKGMPADRDAGPSSCEHHPSLTIFYPANVGTHRAINRALIDEVLPGLGEWVRLRKRWPTYLNVETVHMAPQ